MNNKINWKSVFTVMGAILAFNIGTGFATGQEVMQYFSVFGWWSIGAGIAEHDASMNITADKITAFIVFTDFFMT